MTSKRKEKKKKQGGLYHHWNHIKELDCCFHDHGKMTSVWERSSRPKTCSHEVGKRGIFPKRGGRSDGGKFCTKNHKGKSPSGKKNKKLYWVIGKKKKGRTKSKKGKRTPPHSRWGLSLYLPVCTPRVKKCSRPEGART